MFSLVVQYLGFLKRVPFVPHVYDALLKIQVLLTNRSRLDLFDTIENEVLTWPGISVSVHPYGGLQVNLGKHELGHLHGNGLLDVLLNRQLKTKVMMLAGVLDHHVFKNSGWVSLRVKTTADRDLGIAILREAYAFRKG